MANRKQERLAFYKGSYGSNYKRLRERAGLTQEELGKRLNYSDSAIGAIEKETKYPTIEQINLYVKEFNVSLDYLTGKTNILDIDTQFVCEKIGLTEKALNNIKQIKRSNGSAFFVLNQLLESGAIGDICEVIAKYYDQIEQAENSIDELDHQIENALDNLDKLESYLEPSEPADETLIEHEKDDIANRYSIKETLELLNAERKESAQRYLSYEMYARLKEEIDKIVSRIIP